MMIYEKNNISLILDSTDVKSVARIGVYDAFLNSLIPDSTEINSVGKLLYTS